LGTGVKDIISHTALGVDVTFVTIRLSLDIAFDIVNAIATQSTCGINDALLV